jgi:hypothetical protein
MLKELYFIHVIIQRISVNSCCMLMTIISSDLAILRHALQCALLNMLPVYNLPILLNIVIKALLCKLPLLIK